MRAPRARASPKSRLEPSTLTARERPGRCRRVPHAQCTSAPTPANAPGSPPFGSAPGNHSSPGWASLADLIGHGAAHAVFEPRMQALREEYETADTVFEVSV